MGQIAATVFFFEFQFFQMPEVAFESLADQRRPIYTQPSGCEIRRRQEFPVDDDLYYFHVESIPHINPQSPE